MATDSIQYKGDGFASSPAKWIWDAYNRQTPNFHLLARRGLWLTAPVRRARCLITASSTYRLYINGTEAGWGPDPAEPEWHYYDVRDLSMLLGEGSNVIAVHGHNYGVATHFRPACPGGLLLDAEVELETGEKVRLVSDGSWQTAEAIWYAKDSPQAYWTTGFQEICDLRLRDDDWNLEIASEDSLSLHGASWNWAIEYGGPLSKPFSHLIPREIPFLQEDLIIADRLIGAGTAALPDQIDPALLGIRINQQLPESGLIGNTYLAPNLVHFLKAEAEKPVPLEKVGASSDGLLSPGDILKANVPGDGASARMLFDFGREVVGFVRINLLDAPAGVLDIAYSEALNSEGSLDLDRGIMQADRIVFPQSARIEWSSADRRAFRYVLLSFRGQQGHVKVRVPTATTLGYPVRQVGAFECSDPLLNQIWQTSRDTLAACMQHHYEDGPVRERGQYAGDMRSSALWNYSVFGDTGLIRKGLRMYARAQTDEGWFRTLYPSGTRHLIVDYALDWISALREYYWYSGDEGLALELLPNVDRVLKWLDTFCASSGLIDDADKQDWWVFIDWYDLDRRGAVTALNTKYAQGLEDAAYLHEISGSEQRSSYWRARRGKLVQAVNELLWNEQEGAYSDCLWRGELSSSHSAPTNILAVLSDVAPRERWASIRAFLTSQAKRPTTPLFRIYELLVRLQCGEPVDSMLQGIRDYWGEQLSRGAVSWWETFDPKSSKDWKPLGSLCHAWGSGPLYVLARHLLGVEQTQPGFRRVTVHPHSSSLAYIRGTVPTPLGPLTVAQSADGGRVSLEVAAPPGCQVDVADEERTSYLMVSTADEDIAAEAASDGTAAG